VCVCQHDSLKKYQTYQYKSFVGLIDVVQGHIDEILVKFG
jgi:hypothetical protein